MYAWDRHDILSFKQIHVYSVNDKVKCMFTGNTGYLILALLIGTTIAAYWHHSNRLLAPLELFIGTSVITYWHHRNSLMAPHQAL